MNNFGGAPTMQRRQAMVGGGSPDAGKSQGRPSPMANSFASNQGLGLNRQQPLIDGDFLSEQTDQFGSADQGKSFGFRQQNFQNQNQRGPSGFNQQRPPTGGNQGGPSNFNPYGNNPGQGAGGAPSFNRLASTPAGPSGGMSRTFAGGAQGFGGQQNRTQPGFNQSFANRQQFSGGPGAPGAGRQQFDGSGMNRYNSQQSLAYSNASYGDQYGGGGSGLNRGASQMGRTMQGGFNRGTSNQFMRQGSIGGGFGATQQNFGRSFGTNFGGRANSIGFGSKQTQPQINEQNFQDQRFMDMINYIAGHITDTCSRMRLNTPAQFFMEYDAYESRHFENWEISAMFPSIQGDDLEYLMYLLDADQSQMIPIGLLFSYLYPSLKDLNLNEVKKKRRSEWDERVKKLSILDKQVFTEIAQMFKSQTPRQSYLTTFQNLIGQQEYLQVNQLGGFIQNHQDLMHVQPDSIQAFLDFVNILPQNQIVSVISFVRAQQALSPDTQTRQPSPSPEMMVNASMDRMTGMSEMQMQVMSLDEMLLKIPDKPQNQSLHKFVQQVADNLMSTGTMARLETEFQKAKNVLIKTGIGQSQEQLCCTKLEFEAFLTNLKDPGSKQPIFQSAQINVLSDLYQAELPAQAAARPAAQAQLSQSMGVQEATPEEEQDPPEGEESKIQIEDQKQDENPVPSGGGTESRSGSALQLRRADTDFERVSEEDMVSPEESKETFRPDKTAATTTAADKSNAPAPAPALKEQAKAKVEEEKKDAVKTAEESQKADAAVEEQKEGGEFEEEFYEGGNQELINLQKFKVDIKEACKMTRDVAKNLIIEIFERIKKWYTLTKKSIKLLFRNQDKKRKKFVSKQDLIKVLNRVVRPFELQNQHVMAVLSVIGTQEETIYYERFCYAFFEYANEKAVPEIGHPLAEIINIVRAFADNKSIVTLLANPDTNKMQRDPNVRFTVPYKTLIQKIPRHHGRVEQIDPRQQAELEKILVDTSISPDADLCKLQELMGFEQQELFDVQGNQYRKIAQNMQISLKTVEQVRLGIIGGNRARTMMKKETVIQNWTNKELGVIENQEQWNQFVGMMQEYDDGSQDQVNVEKFIGRIEREMNKYAMIQRFYLLCIKAKEQKKSQFDEVKDFLKTKGLDEDDNMTVESFKAFLYELDLIGSKDEGWDYFQEDFDPDNEQVISGDKFEEDLKEIEPFIDNLVSQIFSMMDIFCQSQQAQKFGRQNYFDENQKTSLKEELLQMQRLNQQMSARGNNLATNILWLHSFDFQRWFQTFVIPAWSGQYNFQFDREVLNVFTTYMSHDEKSPNMIYVPELLKKYIYWFPSFEIEQELSRESLPILIRHVCQVLDQVNRPPDFYFRNETVYEYDFIAQLENQPFNAVTQCEEIDLKSVVRYSHEILSYNKVDVSKFKVLLEQQIAKLVIRSKELLNIRKALDERGMTIENAVKQIKGQSDRLEDQGMSVQDFAQLCLITEVRLDPDTQLMPILDTFEKTVYGEIAALDLIKAVNRAHYGIYEEEGEDEEEKVLVNAKRFFQTAEEVIAEMCHEIEERNITDFGSLLKGNDLFNEGLISHSSFFQILQTMFTDLIGEGDILDVIKKFDRENTGKIFIRDVAESFNRRIYNKANRIKLVSWVDACVEEAIVEPVSPRSKKAIMGSKKDENTADQPPFYKKQMLLDIHCGSLIKSDGDLLQWFTSYANFREGLLSKSEFCSALTRLGVEAEVVDQEIVFEYFLKKVATRTDQLAKFQQTPISQQTLPVGDLVDILNEDYPDQAGIKDKILRMVAIALTEQKLPVLDMLKAYETPEYGQGHIDYNTFAVNLLENDFNLKEKMTRNMINILADRYGQNQTYLNYTTFLDDLESLEQANYSSQIRIFKTQQEINYFQTYGGTEAMDGESYWKNKVLVEPIKEAVLEAQTNKNTHFVPPFEELSSQDGAGSIYNNYLNEGVASGYNRSFDRGPPQPKPLLEMPYYDKIDELIIQTRRIGVSVEGYFQRFGKFSTQDGIRKVDSDQFRDAIGNLDGMQWAKDRPYMMDQLFDAIIIAFENYNQQKQALQMNQTIMSGTNNSYNQDNESPVKDVAAEQGIPKLTLEMIGQIVYHNSTIELDQKEAEYLQELHAVMFDAGLVDKLQDMATFMNRERDSSCSIDQFKRLLLNTMKLDGKMREDRIDVILQRYRQNAYKDAKIQRDELYGLNVDQLKMIKKGFSDYGKQLIQMLGLYHDLGYQQRKIGLKDQWACFIAEDIVKAYQVKLLEDRQLPMTDMDVASQMHAYFLRNCQGHPDQLTYTDYTYILTSMQLWDGQVYSRGQLEDFFKICQREEVAESSFFNPNTMNLEPLVVPQYIPTQQFVKAFEFLSRKPLNFIYQEILDKFYVISKRQHISISGPIIMHLFDYDDIEETGFVGIDEFVGRIQEFLQRKKFKGNAIVTNYIANHDLHFLATKYMQRDGRSQVKYVAFIEDYDEIEKLGLGAGSNQLSMREQSVRRDTALKNTAGQAGAWRVKTINEVQPPESRILYQKMASYLTKKDLIDSLCLSLVNSDQARDGFLNMRIIGEIVTRNGMKISEKQLTLLTQALGMNHTQEYNYLEMIALLGGEVMMYTIMRDNNINFGGMAVDDAPKKIDMSLMNMSERLKDQIELKYGQLNQKVTALTRGTQQIRDQELFKVFKECEVVCDMNDIELLEQYLTFQRSQENNTISFHIFLEHFKISSLTSDLLSDIVRQLTAKKVVIEEVTSQRRFSLQQFKELLTRLQVAIADQQSALLEKLFNKMSERQEEVSRARLIECFGKDFTNIGKPMQKQKTGKRQLPEPPYVVNSFLTFLVNNKLNLRQIFSEETASKRISVKQLKEFCESNHYQSSQGDFSVIVRFFTPPNAMPSARSARSGGAKDGRKSAQSLARDRSRQSLQTEEDDPIDLIKIIVYARRIDVNYAKDDVAEGGPNAQGARKTVLTSFPQKIQKILKRLGDYMIDNQISKEQLFAELDRNNDSRISQLELIQFVTNKQMIEGLVEDDIAKLFSFLDVNQNDSISINELCLLIQGQKLSTEARLKSFSFEFDAQLRTEIEALFNRLDTDRSNFLTANELVQMVRPTDKGGSITLEKAYAIIQNLDANGDGHISKKEFVAYILPRQKRQILDFEDQMEDLRRLFKEQIAEGVAADPTENQLGLLNKNQFVTKAGLKNLIIKSGHRQVTDQEVDAIFTEMDTDQNGILDIDEFMAFVLIADRIKTKNPLARDAVFNIRKARLKLNSLDLLDMFLKMPLSFLPSYSQQEIEQRKNNLPIHGIQFHFDHQTMGYTGLQKIKDLRAKQNQPRLYIAQYKPKVGIEIELKGEAFNVPLIQKLKQEYISPHIEVRIVLFDMKSKVYLSNFFMLGAEAIRKPAPKNKATVVDQISANMRYDPNLASFYLASDHLENENASLVIEFVIYGTNSMAIDPKEKKDKGHQVTVAWTHVQVAKLVTQVKHKLELKGGNPFKEQDIHTAEDTEQAPESKSFLKKVFGGGSAAAKKVERYLNLEVKPFNKITEQAQMELSSLSVASQSVIVAKPLLSLVVTFRNHCYLLLTKHEQEMTKPNLDLVMVQFPKIYNNPDFQSALSACWSNIPLVSPEENGVVSNAKLLKLDHFVQMIYSVMFEYNVKLDQIYPTRSTPLNQTIYRARQIALKQTLMAGNAAFMQKVNLEVRAQEELAAQHAAAGVAVEGAIEPTQEGETLFMEDYVPFGMGEICGNYDGFDGDDAVAGFSVDQEQVMNEMERKYAAGGLYI